MNANIQSGEELIEKYENVTIFGPGFQISTDLTVIDIRLDSLMKIGNHILSDLRTGYHRNQFKYNQFIRIIKTTSQSIRSQNIMIDTEVEFICKILDDIKQRFYSVEITNIGKQPYIQLQQMTAFRDELEKNINLIRNKYGMRPLVEN